MNIILTINNGGTNHRPDLETAWAAADLVGTGSREQLLELARSGDPSSRYWAIIGLRYASPDDQELLEQLEKQNNRKEANFYLQKAHKLFYYTTLTKQTL